LARLTGRASPRAHPSDRNRKIVQDRALDPLHTAGVVERRRIMRTTPLIKRLAGADRAPEARPTFTPHPAFAGVRLARLVATDDSGGALATLLVMLEPGARMAPHRHDHQTEQHLVLSGDGRVVVDGVEHGYAPGSLQVIREGLEHAVTAGADGLTLMAVFTPAA
jgi:quercetin dioxygenase-like cupin family protein